jgi:hypothetical protein
MCASVEDGKDTSWLLAVRRNFPHGLRRWPETPVRRIARDHGCHEREVHVILCTWRPPMSADGRTCIQVFTYPYGSHSCMYNYNYLRRRRKARKACTPAGPYTRPAPRSMLVAAQGRARGGRTHARTDGWMVWYMCMYMCMYMYSATPPLREPHVKRMSPREADFGIRE